MSDRFPRPDPNNLDAWKGPAGEGWSEDGDAWYHDGLLLPQEEDDALARAQTRERIANTNNPASIHFQCHVLAEDIEGGRYLIDVGFGYARIYDEDVNRLFGPMRNLHMKFHWAHFTGDEQAVLEKARNAHRIRRDPPEAEVDPDLLNERP